MATDHCPVIEMTDELLSRLEVDEPPPGYPPDPEKLRSHLRHWLTNYDDLLEEYEEVGERATGAFGLGILCIRYIFENGGTCTYNGGERPWEDCPTLNKVYNALKWTAEERAEQVYRQWLKRQEK